MRHRVDHRKLSRPTDQRVHLLNNLTRQFLRAGYVHTTLGKAKEVQRMAEKLITLAKKDDVAARRKARQILVGHSKATMPKDRLQGDEAKEIKMVAMRATRLAGKSDAEKLEVLQRESLINGEDLVTHLFENIAPRYKERKGGYTRVTKTGLRRGDAAMTAVLELVD
jgi:large subunit ribosomal protein L17